MGWRDWTGVGERRWETAPNEQVQPSKTLWDWLQLLIVPVILVGVTFLWSASQTSRDNRREDRRIAADRLAAEEVRRDATLNDYFQRMSDLMLNKRLLSSKPPDAVRSVARTVTLTTLRRLDGGRKGEVVRFLEEAVLIGVSGSLVRLAGANLNFADLTDADLTVADLRGADLTRADLTGALLGGTDLRDADLTRADLRGAFLGGADFIRADLTDADLTRADLTVADLRGADLTRADLTSADLTGANLRDADLTDANLRDADLTDADLLRADLRGADLTGAKGLPKRRR